MYKYRYRQLPASSGGDLFRFLENCFRFFYRDSTVFILADIQRPNKNRDRVSTLWTELPIAHVPSFFYFNEPPRLKNMVANKILGDQKGLATIINLKWLPISNV